VFSKWKAILFVLKTRYAIYFLQLWRLPLNNGSSVPDRFTPLSWERQQLHGITQWQPVTEIKRDVSMGGRHVNDVIRQKGADEVFGSI
jgi:hypothetical protein